MSRCFQRPGISESSSDRKIRFRPGHPRRPLLHRLTATPCCIWWIPQATNESLLSATGHKRILLRSEDPISAGSSSQAFTAPFDGDAVLYLVDTAGHK